MLASVPRRYCASLSRTFTSRAGLAPPLPPLQVRPGGSLPQLPLDATSESAYEAYEIAGGGDAADPAGGDPDADGEPDPQSPEHMLLTSLGLCLLSSFEVFAARDGIELLAWRAKISGTVEPTPEGPMFTSIVLELDVAVDGNTERFDDALEDAKRCCLVQNALRVPVVVETQLHTPCIPAPIEDSEPIEFAPLLARARRELHAS